MILSFLIFWPLFVSLILLVVRMKNAKELALTASLIELAVSLLVVFQFNKTADVQLA